MLHCFFSKPVAIDLPIGEIPCRVGFRAVWVTCRVGYVPCGCAKTVRTLIPILSPID